MKISQKIAAYEAVYMACRWTDFGTANMILATLAKRLGLEHYTEKGYFFLARRDRILPLISLKQHPIVKPFILDVKNATT